VKWAQRHKIHSCTELVHVCGCGECGFLEVFRCDVELLELVLGL
jgi:hypothetical protein